MDDLIDVVLPRASMPQFFRKARDLALAEGAVLSGCGHAGDGNVHGVIFCKDPDVRKRLLTDIFALGMELGGAISGEHGLGRAKGNRHEEHAMAPPSSPSSVVLFDVSVCRCFSEMLATRLSQRG